MQPDGSFKPRIADAVTEIDGKLTAIEAKFTKDWDKSIYNPNSKNGDRFWAVDAQTKMLSQAQDYARNFQQVTYHTNSRQLMDHYNSVFAKQGLTNVQFMLTPEGR